MPTGTVKFFHDWKGYGFIETDAIRDDVFFHVDDVAPDQPEPREGDALSFEIHQAPKGPRAVNVELSE